MKKKKFTLKDLITKRKENIIMLSTWSDEDLDRIERGYRAAYLKAYENKETESAAFLREKVDQISAAMDWKMGQTEEACDWIHW